MATYSYRVQWETNHTHLYEDSDGLAIFLRVDRRTETNFGSFNYLVSVVI